MNFTLQMAINSSLHLVVESLKPAIHLNTVLRPYVTISGYSIENRLFPTTG
jgi:hypothetical protein